MSNLVCAGNIVKVADLEQIVQDALFAVVGGEGVMLRYEEDKELSEIL